VDLVEDRCIMGSDHFTVKDRVRHFDREGGWYFVAVPVEYSEELADLADRGLVPIRATVGQTSWDTSLLPMGDGTHFVALGKPVRKAEDLEVGDQVELTFTPREP
jgi:hypothetical protein